MLLGNVIVSVASAIKTTAKIWLRKISSINNNKGSVDNWTQPLLNGQPKIKPWSVTFTYNKNDHCSDPCGRTLFERNLILRYVQSEAKPWAIKPRIKNLFLALDGQCPILLGVSMSISHHLVHHRLARTHFLQCYRERIISILLLTQTQEHIFCVFVHSSC